MISRRLTDDGRGKWQSILTLGLAATLVMCTALPLAGCRKEEPAPPPPPPPPPPKQTIPEWSEILITVPTIEKVSVDTAVRQDCTKPQMQESIRFVNAFASGDDQALAPMLDSLSQDVLTDLVSQGLWQTETEGIRELTLLNCTGSGGDFSIGFTIATDSGDSQTYTWNAKMRGDTGIFTPFVRMPEEPDEEVATDNGDEAASNDDREGGDSGGGRQPGKGRPERDPRKRVPPQGPDPGDPNGPG
ncbi:MAG: hypothetical protein D8M59_00970 [Planctomycetes bacterium]|nr:hypothetical protein [Planctomycetota bacterium]NOG54708.1 hypothetical protein [Planctomycetota bacterium]